MISMRISVRANALWRFQSRKRSRFRKKKQPFMYTSGKARGRRRTRERKRASKQERARETKKRCTQTTTGRLFPRCYRTGQQMTSNSHTCQAAALTGGLTEHSSLYIYIYTHMHASVHICTCAIYI